MTGRARVDEHDPGVELEITCALNTSADSPEHARVAEQLLARWISIAS